MENRNSRSRAARRARRRRAFRRQLLLVFIVGLLGFGAYAVWDVLRPPEISEPPPVADTPPQKTTPEDPDPVTAVVSEPVPSVEEPEKKVRKESFYTFVLAGTNDDYNTDTIMLGSVDTEKDVINVVSIPRDTMVDVDINIKKINNSYGRKGMEELCLQIQRLTGVYPDYYCLVNMEDFIEVVDVIGGVYFDVPYRMYHEDADERFNIHLNKGYQLLDGKKAIQLVRFRGTSASDYGRMEMQRDFLKAVGKKMVQEFTISQASDLISVISKSIKTNMPVKDMIWFYVNVVRDIDFDNSITFSTMPGTTVGRYQKQDYVYLDPDATLEYINEYINPYTTDIRKSELRIIKLVDPEDPGR